MHMVVAAHRQQPLNWITVASSNNSNGKSAARHTDTQNVRSTFSSRMNLSLFARTNSVAGEFGKTGAGGGARAAISQYKRGPHQPPPHSSEVNMRGCMWIEWRGIEGGRQQPHYEEQPQTEKKRKGRMCGNWKGECGSGRTCVRPRRYAGGDCLSHQCTVRRRGGEIRCAPCKREKGT